MAIDFSAYDITPSTDIGTSLNVALADGHGIEAPRLDAMSETHATAIKSLLDEPDIRLEPEDLDAIAEDSVWNY